MFEFDRHIPVGQYEFPFKIKLPTKLPSTFNTIYNNGESYEIKYTLKIYFNDPEPILFYQKDIKIVRAIKIQDYMTRKVGSLMYESRRGISSENNGSKNNKEEDIGFDDTSNSIMKKLDVTPTPTKNVIVKGKRKVTKLKSSGEVLHKPS